MLETLRAKVLTLPDDVVVPPGHGEQTSIGRERPPTRSCSTSSTAARPARSPEDSDHGPTPPLSGFPETAPAARVVEREVSASLARTFELHGFANIETRAVEPLGPSRQGRRDRQGDLRPAEDAGDGRRRRHGSGDALPT
jgi:hypothetical protein